MDIINSKQTQQRSVNTVNIQKRHHNKRNKYFLTAAVIVIVAAMIITLGLWVFGKSNLQRIDTNKYQVVYLANGQAYFGKLENTTGEYLVVKTPYTAQSVKSDSKDTATDNTTTLLKVSAQVYGPDESIAIKSDQVLFWQNLRSDSKVSKAIDAKT